MNLTEAIDWATDQLTAQRIEDARLEAELLLVHALEIKRSSLVLYQSMTVEKSNFDRFRKLVERRLKHEPTAYILGNQPFHGLNILVDKNVLIPRPETEQLVEIILGSIDRNAALKIADIGTGSGCIAVSLAKALPNATVYGLDASGAALKVAQKNAELNQVAGRCTFLKGSLLGPLKEKMNIIVANPPYIPTAEIAKLQPEVRDWEPRVALDGGPDGLKYIREIIRQAPNHLTTQPPGRLFLEFGFGQAAQIAELAKAVFPKFEISRDHAGLERFLSSL
jgi:release factor glutamine methyltransferase